MGEVMIKERPGESNDMDFVPSTNDFRKNKGSNKKRFNEEYDRIFGHNSPYDNVEPDRHPDCSCPEWYQKEYFNETGEHAGEEWTCKKHGYVKIGGVHARSYMVIIDECSEPVEGYEARILGKFKVKRAEELKEKK